MDNKLNLKNDVVFKAFFSKKGNEKYLKEFLESLLKIHIEKIEVRSEVSLLKLDEKEKGGRLDIEATLNDGLIVNIEMQVNNLHNMEERTTFYASKILSREVTTKEEYKNIKPIIMVNILDYEIFGFNEYVSETAIVLEKHRDYEALKKLKWYFIELPKFRMSNPDMEDKLNQWLALIDNEDRGMIKMAEEKNKTIKEAKKEVEYLTGEEEIKRLAELREKWAMDRRSEISDAREEGIEEGRKEGRKEGIEEGRKEGRKEGKEEGKKEEKLAIAKNMLNKGKSEEDILDFTGISKEELEKLKEAI